MGTGLRPVPSTTRPAAAAKTLARWRSVKKT